MFAFDLSFLVSRKPWVRPVLTCPYPSIAPGPAPGIGIKLLPKQYGQFSRLRCVESSHLSPLQHSSHPNCPLDSLKVRPSVRLSAGVLP
jgi:hypothetical protein